MPTDDSDDDGAPPAVGHDPFPSQEELLAGLEDISLTPAQHQRLKDLVNSDLDAIKGYERRYLSVGAGSDTEAATRREIVYDSLDARTDPPAVAFRLEDYGLSRERITLWARAFDIPLAAIRKRGGGRPLTDAVSDEDDAAAAERPDSPGEAQQRPNTVADGSGHDEVTAVDTTEQTGSEPLDDREQRDAQASREQPEIREHVQQAIAALQTLDEAL